MTLSATLHNPARVDGAAQPMPHNPELGRLALEDRDGNRVVVFMPAAAALAMAHAYAAALATPVAEAAE